MSGAKPKAAVLHNAPILPEGHPDAVAERDVLMAVDAVARALSDHGFDPVPVAVGPPVAAVLAMLERLEPDVLFNLVEGFGGTSVGATNFTGLLELTGLPLTGSPAEALALCLSKARAKALLRGFGLPTAPFLMIAPGENVPDWPWAGPALVKPDAEDGSLGIDQTSVVSNHSEAQARVRRVHEAYQGSALLEAYLPGPEYNVGVIALPQPQALPIAEIVYRPSAGDWPILTYAAKWDAGSAEDLASLARCPAQVDPTLADQLGRLAIAAYRVTGCRDYARIDIRLNESGEPMILEVNPNPDIGPTAGWARALLASGRDYGQTIGALARQAMRRGEPPGRCVKDG